MIFDVTFYLTGICFLCLSYGVVAWCRKKPAIPYIVVGIWGLVVPISYEFVTCVGFWCTDPVRKLITSFSQLMNQYFLPWCFLLSVILLCTSLCRIVIKIPARRFLIAGLVILFVVLIFYGTINLLTPGLDYQRSTITPPSIPTAIE